MRLTLFSSAPYIASIRFGLIVRRPVIIVSFVVVLEHRLQPIRDIIVVIRLHSYAAYFIVVALICVSVGREYGLR